MRRPGQGLREISQRQVLVERGNFPTLASHGLARIRIAGRPGNKPSGGALVVGLPLNMDGSEGDQAKLTRRFGDKLAQVSGLAVHYWDERLSSVTARRLMIPAELSRKKRKARLDRVAAQVILQSFLDTGDSGAMSDPAE